MFLTRQECAEIIRLHDTSRTYTLYFPDFLGMTLTKERPKLKSNVLQRKSYTQTNIGIPSSVNKNLAKILKKEWEFVQETKEFREKMKNSPKIGLKHMFELIDTEKENFLNLLNIHAFMRKNGDKLTNNEIYAILRRLDANKDEKISYLDFEYQIIGGDDKFSLVEPKSEPRGRQIEKIPYRPIYYSPQPKREYLSKIMSPKQKSEKESTISESPIIIGKTIVEDPQNEPKIVILPQYEEQKSSQILPEPAEIPSYVTPIRSNIKNDISPSDQQAECPTSAQSPEFKKIDYLEKGSPVFSKQIDPESNKKLANLFKSQLAIDAELEETKMNLCMQADFNLFDAFKFLDINAKGSISLYELKSGLEFLQQKVNAEHLILLMRRYDNDLNGSLSFEEFSKMFTPLNEKYAELLKNRESVAENGELVFSYETNKIFTEALLSIIKMEALSENIRKKQKSICQNLQEAFTNFGYLDKQNISELMSAHKYQIKENELNLLMERYDKNNDSKISLDEVFLRENINYNNSL